MNMTTQITLTLSDEIYKRAEHFAHLTGQAVEEVIAARVGDTLPPLVSELDSRPVETLLDDEVISLAESMMDERLSDRMSALSQKQREDVLTSEEQIELRMLFEIYNVGQLRKAQALAQAVKRGLRPPLSA